MQQQHRDGLLFPVVLRCSLIVVLLSTSLLLVQTPLFQRHDHHRDHIIATLASSSSSIATSYSVRRIPFSSSHRSHLLRKDDINQLSVRRRQFPPPHINQLSVRRRQFPPPHNRDSPPRYLLLRCSSLCSFSTVGSLGGDEEDDDDIHSNQKGVRRNQHQQQQQGGSDIISTAAKTQPTEQPKKKESSFDDFDLHPSLFKGLDKLGFVRPTPVQRAALPRALLDASVAVQSFTGSGKTAIFLLPILSRALEEVDEGRLEGAVVKHLIISPSRELCMQILRTAEDLLGTDNKWMVQQLIGGANEIRQKKALKDKRPLVVIGTPGRIGALLKGHLGLHHVEIVALDEADKLLEMGFRNEMDTILSHAGRKVEDGPQYLLTSASLTQQSMREMSDTWGLPEMCEIYAKAPKTKQTHQQSLIAGSISPTISHWYVTVDPKHRVSELRKVVNALNVPKVLVFMNYAKRLKDTLFRLNAASSTYDTNTDILHSEMPKTVRQNVIRRFNEGKVRALVVTDVISRGMDLDCDAVVNLELPEDPELYAHRAGRTGRMGKTGVVVSLVAPFESKKFEKLQQSVGLNMSARRAYKGKMIELNDQKL